jgi:cellulose synthase/poly-beta-1,6-N-acetylglucosamine synthase-like glycosyltransferase
LKELITIGIPVYNEENTIYKTLISAIRSAEKMHKKYEFFICFNGTTDKSREIVREFKRRNPAKIKIIESKKGKTKAIKKIMEKSDSDYLLFCDGDVFVEEDCFENLIKNFSKLEVMAVTGNPRPWRNKSIIYKILNARMIYPKAEIAKIALDGFFEKPFIHGRIYAIRRKIFQKTEDLKKFENSIGDDTYLTHYIIQKYGRKAIFKEYKSVVNYLAVQSLNSWWSKWFRIWSDIEKLYKDNPNFFKLHPFMKTKLNWKYINTLPMPVPIYFFLERTLNYFGKIYFNFKKNKRKETWKRLEDTKIIPK